MKGLLVVVVFFGNNFSFSDQLLAHNRVIFGHLLAECNLLCTVLVVNCLDSCSLLLFLGITQSQLNLVDDGFLVELEVLLDLGQLSWVKAFDCVKSIHVDLEVGLDVANFGDSLVDVLLH